MNRISKKSDNMERSCEVITCHKKATKKVYVSILERKINVCDKHYQKFLRVEQK